MLARIEVGPADTILCRNIFAVFLVHVRDRVERKDGAFRHNFLNVTCRIFFYATTVLGCRWIDDRESARIIDCLKQVSVVKLVVLALFFIHLVDLL